MIKTNKILIKGNTSSLLKSYLLGGSIVDYLNSQGLASDWNTRKAMARRYGVTDYKGTADQNLRLMELIKSNQGMSPTTTMQGVPVTREVEDGRAETYTPDFTVKTPGYIDMTLYQKPVAQPLTFKLAFRNALNAGLAEFEWNGGKYNTALKSNTSVLTSTPAKPRAPWESNIMAAAPSNNTEVLPGASSVGLDPNNLSNTRTKEENLEILKKQAGANYVAPTNTVSSAALTKEVPTEQWRSYSYEKQLELRKQGYYPKGDLAQGWKNFISGLKQYTNRRINTSIPTSYRPAIRR